MQNTYSFLVALWAPNSLVDFYSFAMRPRLSCFGVVKNPPEIYWTPKTKSKLSKIMEPYCPLIWKLPGVELFNLGGEGQ